MFLERPGEVAAVGPRPVPLYGTRSSLEWHQEHPNELLVKRVDNPQIILRRGNSYLSRAARANTRLPFGHPEAFIEAFANVYLAAAGAIADDVSGRTPKGSHDFPTVDDGVMGMAFIETVVRSSKAKAKWTKFPSV